MNALSITTSSLEGYQHKVLFRPQGILAYVNSILPNGGILRFDQMGSFACACFDNTIDYNRFKAKLAIVRNPL